MSNHGIPGDYAYTQGTKARQGSGTVHCFPFEGVSDSKQYLHLQAAKVTQSEYQVEDRSTLLKGLFIRSLHLEVDFMYLTRTKREPIVDVFTHDIRFKFYFLNTKTGW